jgi:hypothetical protein
MPLELEPLDEPEPLPEPPELDEFFDASGFEPLSLLVVLEPPPHPAPTATITATRQPKPEQALKAFIRDSPC